MHFRTALAAAAVLAAVAVPAEAVRNSSWNGRSTMLFRYAIAEPVEKAHRKGRVKEVVPAAALIGLDASFIQAPGGGKPALRGALTEVDPRTSTTSAAGFEEPLGTFLRARLLPLLEPSGAVDLTFESVALSGRFRQNKGLSRVRGKNLLAFQGAVVGGVEDGKSLSGTVRAAYKGSRSEGGPVVGAR